MQNAISINMALTMAGPKPPSRTTSLRTIRPVHNMNRPASSSSQSVSLYNGVSDRPLGWKPRRSARNPGLGSTAKDMNIKRWDGAARLSSEWDGLRKDPELWYHDGNCLVHLYDQGQSRRGPAFKVPMEALLVTECQPLISRFLAKPLIESPGSDADTERSTSTYFRPTAPKMYELYIPPPPTAERGQAFLYHTATRNLFAWIFGKSLVGNHLGGALVGLLNSMNEFRSPGEDNVQAIMDYMDEEGYAEMRNQPDHALAILFFAEHFHFKDLWVDAFAHCTGMNERLISCPGFEFMSRTSRALVTRSRFEMDMRLDDCGRRLGSFLCDDLSDAHLGLSSGARAHLDKFRSFLQSYYVAKLGYYPPTSCAASSSTFPKNIYGQMCSEFQKLYEFLVDSEFTTTDNIPVSQQGGICVLQCVQAYDQRHRFSSLRHPIPLLPEIEETASSKPGPNKRFSFAPRDKMKPDPRLVTFASLAKATNGKDQSFFDCSLVRAYRGFEKDCVFSPLKADKSDKLSQTDARKVRWILIYAILQTLLSATRVPDQVRDTQNVSYNISVLTAGCPPWKEERPYETLLRTQTDQTREDFIASKDKAKLQTAPVMQIEIKPDVDYFAINQKAKHARYNSGSSMLSIDLKKSSIRKALSTLGNMPELKHPRPRRASFHEILIQGYGNGTNTVITAEPAPQDVQEPSSPRKSSESGSSLNISSEWSNTSIDANDLGSLTTSSSSHSRRGSDASTSIDLSKKNTQELLERPMSALGLTDLTRVPSSVYSNSVYEESILPDPLQVKRHLEEEYMRVTREVKVNWEDSHGQVNEELLDYLNA